MRSLQLLSLCSVTVVALTTGIGGRVSAQTSDSADRWLEILRGKPRGMRAESWRAQRREAARALGEQRDRRAVPLLLNIVSKERFDVVLEIAIEALGKIGDAQAIGPLRKLLNDPSLDAYARDAVANALTRIEQDRGSKGARPTSQPTRAATGDNTSTTRGLPVGEATDAAPVAISGEFAKLPSLRLGDLAADTIARADRFDIIAGAGSLRWDRRLEDLGASVAFASHYRRQVERKAVGYSLDAAAHVGYGYSDPRGADNTTWKLEHSADLRPEVRYYPFRNDLPLLFGQCSGGLSYGFTLASLAAARGNRTAFGSTISVGVGPGYGRIIDVESRLRLERLQRILNHAGLLQRPIDARLARDLMQIWYELRNRIGSFAQLGHSLRLLREGGVLVEDVDPAVVYKAIRVLDDPQLLGRRSGLMARIGYGYAHDIVTDSDDRDYGFLYATGEAAWQLGTQREVLGALRFAWNHLGTPHSYGLTAEGSHNWFLYNSAFDPLGAIGVTASVGLSKQPIAALDDGGMAYRMTAGASYTRFFDRGSRVIATLAVGAERGGGLVLLSVEARYGIAVGSFAAPLQ